MIDEFKKTYRLENVLIIGKKSIGKTSLLEKIEQKLTNSFAVTRYPLSTNEIKDPLDFFIELFDKIINQYEEWDGFLNKDDIQEWKNIINGYTKDSSNYLKRVFEISTAYQNNGNIREDILINDFKRLISELNDSVEIPEVSDSDSGEVSDTIPINFRTLVLVS